MPQFVKFDMQFDVDAFKTFLQENDITPHKLPVRRHNKFSMESKHRVLRDIYIRLKHAAPDESFSHRVAKTFRISNDLYGNDVMSAYESAKGFTRPIIPSSTTKKVPEDIRISQKELIAKRKRNLMLRPKTIRDPKLSVGDRVQVYIKDRNGKRGCWSEQKPVLHCDPQSGIVTFAGKQGRKLQPAVEDVRYALQSPFVVSVQNAVDQIDSEVHEALSPFEVCPVEEHPHRGEFEDTSNDDYVQITTAPDDSAPFLPSLATSNDAKSCESERPWLQTVYEKRQV